MIRLYRVNAKRIQQDDVSETKWIDVILQITVADGRIVDILELKPS